jgi:hypothetical protein
MGQFKPMVKMETTEPSVILKLKKGGHVNMKKGGKAESGHKKMAMGGGAMAALADTPALLGRPAVNAPVQTPGKPSMAMRRQAMMAKKPAMPMARPPMPMGNPNMPAPMKKGGKANFEMSGKDVEKRGMPEGSKADMALDKKQMMGMKKGGMKRMAEGGDMDLAQDKAMIKKAFKQHDMQEHKGGKGTSLKLKKGGKYATGGAIPSEDSYGNYDTTKVYEAKKDTANGTGGVRFGNAGGFKKGGKAMKMASGGAIPSEDSYGNYDTTKVYEAKANKASGTGGIRLGNAGGFKRGGKAKMATGGVMESNGGGYRKGGATKKFAKGGSVQNDGGPEMMPQGRKPASQPVAINALTGAYKRGGKVAPNNKALQSSFDSTNAPAMNEAKMDTRLKYGSDTYQNQTIPAMPKMKKSGGRAC